MNRKSDRALPLVVALVCSAPALAHHSDAGRYEETLTTVTGTVVEVQLINPHSILILDVRDEDGRLVRWRGELGSPVALKRLGWVSGAVRGGDTMTMRGRRLKNGSPYMTLSECALVSTADGRQVFRGNDPGRPPGEPATEVTDPCAGPIR